MSWSRFGLSFTHAAAILAVGAALAIRIRATELSSFTPGTWTWVAIAALSVLTLAGWMWLVFSYRNVVRALGNSGLALIGLLSGLQFVVSYVSRFGGGVLYALLGPFGIFISGIGDEGLLCLLTAVAVTLLPKPGTLTLTYLTLFLLNSIVTGLVNLLSILFISISIAIGELLLAAFAITLGSRFRETRSAAPTNALARMGLAIGLGNSLTMAAQYAISYAAYRLHLGNWYMAAVALGPGLIYGAGGAWLGTRVGYRLRRTAP